MKFYRDTLLNITVVVTHEFGHKTALQFCASKMYAEVDSAVYL